MPTHHRFRFDDFQRVQNSRGQRIESSKHRPVQARESHAARRLAAQHIQLVPQYRISATRAARELNGPAKAYQISLQSSLITREHQPIRAAGPARIRFPVGTPLQAETGSNAALLLGRPCTT
jgi:hypothetical protein